MKKFIVLMLLAAALAVSGCTTYVKPPPPPLRVEIKPARPNKKAVWVPGHWTWRGKRRGYVWIPGHWKVVRR